MISPKLSTIRKGNGPKRLVFLHGLCGIKEIWNSQIDFFSSQNEVIAIDLLGHGESSEVSAKDLIPKSAQLILEFLAALPSRPTILIGHSLGGWVLNELLHLNNKFAAAVFVDAPCMYSEDKLHDYRIFKDTILKSSDRPEIIRNWFSSLITPDASAQTQAVVVENALKFSPVWLAEIMGFTQPSLRAPFDGPLAVMEGIQYYSEGNRLSWLALYPKAKHWLYQKPGHFFFLEDPKPFNEELKTFIESVHS